MNECTVSLQGTIVPWKCLGSAINHTRASLGMKADVVTMTEHDWEGDMCRQKHDATVRWVDVEGCGVRWDLLTVNIEDDVETTAGYKSDVHKWRPTCLSRCYSKHCIAPNQFY